MTNKQARPMHPTDVPPQLNFRLLSSAIVALLALALTGAWLFRIGDSSLLAASLALVVGLMAVAIPSAFRRRDGSATTPSSMRSPIPATAPAGAAPRYRAANAGDEPVLPAGAKRWSLDVFAAMDAQRFAAVCETWFSWAGFDTRSQSHRTGEGVDIWLHAARTPGPVAIVRCKHWIDKPVGLPEMKEFLALVAKFQSAHGTYTTTSTYTPEALQFAEAHGIDAVDGKGLLRRIKIRTRQRQQELLAVAYDAPA